MTPLYDVISVWPYIGDGANQFRWRTAGLAMAVRAKNAHYTFHSIRARHWHALAMKNGGPPVWQAMLGMIGQVEGALAAVESRLPRSFPSRTWDAIQTGMRSQAHAVHRWSERTEEQLDLSNAALPEPALDRCRGNVG